MKVLYLTNIPSPYRVDFFNELSKYCELTVVYESLVSTERNEEWVAQAQEGYKKIVLSGLRVRADARFCPGVIRFLRKNRFDIVVVGGYATPTAMLAITVLRLKGIPFALNADGGFVNQQESVSKYKLKRNFISKANWWLSTGFMTSEYFSHYGADSDRIFEYPFSSIWQAEILSEPISREQKLELRKKLNVECDKLVLSVGRFISQKGYQGFLTEWIDKKKTGTGLIIIGGGPEEETYKSMASRHHDIWILPFMKKRELLEYYMAADTFVLPTDGDVWGLVINEAMSFGLPVFSTTRCIAAITMKCSGIELFEPGDSAAMIEAIETVLKTENSSVEKDIGDVVLSCAKEYTIEKMARRHMEIFERIISER